MMSDTSGDLGSTYAAGITAVAINRIEELMYRLIDIARLPVGWNTDEPGRSEDDPYPQVEKSKIYLVAREALKEILFYPKGKANIRFKEGGEDLVLIRDEVTHDHELVDTKGYGDSDILDEDTARHMASELVLSLIATNRSRRGELSLILAKHILASAKPTLATKEKSE